MYNRGDQNTRVVHEVLATHELMGVALTYGQGEVPLCVVNLLRCPQYAMLHSSAHLVSDLREIEPCVLIDQKCNPCSRQDPHDIRSNASIKASHAFFSPDPLHNADDALSESLL